MQPQPQNNENTIDAISGIGRRMAKGAGWTVSTRLALSATGLISTTILVRLLVPEDFGLVALATMLMAGLEVFGEFGPAFVLIQFQKADRRYYDTVWTLTVIRGVVIAVLLSVLAAPAAVFLKESRLEQYLRQNSDEAGRLSSV